MNNSLYNLTYLNEMSGGDKVFVQKMIELFVNMAKENTTKLNVAVSNEDCNEIFGIVHGMKPAALQMEMTTISDVIAQIESHSKSELPSIKDISPMVTELAHNLNKVVEELVKEQIV